MTIIFHRRRILVAGFVVLVSIGLLYAYSTTNQISPARSQDRYAALAMGMATYGTLMLVESVFPATSLLPRLLAVPAAIGLLGLRPADALPGCGRGQDGAESPADLAACL